MDSNERNELQDALERGLRRICELTGIDVSAESDGPIAPNPVELLYFSQPDLWLPAAALHLTDIAATCADICDGLRVLTGDEELGNDVDGGYFYVNIVTDLEFHVFSFPVYAEVIREKTIDGLALPDYAFLVPESVTLSAEPARVRTLEEAIRARTSVPDEQVPTMAADLADLELACAAARDRIEVLASVADADLPALGQRFANVQAALLTLALVILRADVAAHRLLSAW